MKKEENLSEKEPLEKEAEEELEEELKSDSEEDEDEFELEDILAEERLKSNSNRLHQFLISQNNTSTLSQRATSPILNLEEDLPEPPRNQSKTREEETKIEYFSSSKEDTLSYKPSSNSSPASAQKRDFTKLYEPENQFSQKQMYSSVSSISSEVAFIQKQSTPHYLMGEKINPEDVGKEKKKTIDTLDTMKQSYR